MSMLNNLKFALLRSGKPQYVVAAALRLSETRLSRIVLGRLTPTPEEQRCLAAYLGEDIQHLFGHDTPPSAFRGEQPAPSNKPEGAL